MTVPEMNDHDLLIMIHTQLLRALSDIDALRKTLDSDKMNKDDSERLVAESDKIHQDHEKRLRRVETWGAYAIGVVGFIELIAVLTAAAVRFK